MPDTLLFQDVLSSLEFSEAATTVILEVGCGAAPLAALLAMHLGTSVAAIASDISTSAMTASADTARRNRITMHLARMDMVSALRPGLVDLLVCHPPYVPTSAHVLEEALSQAAAGDTTGTIEAASWTWAGGPGGCGMLLRLLEALPMVLSAHGFALLLWYERDLSISFGEQLEALGLRSSLVCERHAGGEYFCVLRVDRCFGQSRTLSLDGRHNGMLTESCAHY